MNDVIRQAQAAEDPYDLLPECIKLSLTRTEYRWLSDHEKATLIQRETEPDY